MKRSTFTVFLLALLSLLAGYLLSAISLVGRVGINLFYKEYRFLKTWWKGALLVFIAWLLLLAIHEAIYKRAKRKTANTAILISLLIAIAGLYFSYADFRHTLSHRWLGERFHLGVYLFWLVWMGIVVFVFVKNKDVITTKELQVPHP